MNSMVIVEYTSSFLKSENFFSYKIHKIEYTDYKDLYVQLVCDKKLGKLFEDASKFLTTKNKNIHFGIICDDKKRAITGKEILNCSKNFAHDYCYRLHTVSTDIKLHVYKTSYSIFFSSLNEKELCCIIHSTKREIYIDIYSRFFSINRYLDREIISNRDSDSDSDSVSDDSDLGVEQWRYDYAQKDIEEGKQHTITYNRFDPVKYFVLLFLIEKRSLKTFRNDVLFDINVLRIVREY